jgi:hypothetical protein
MSGLVGNGGMWWFIRGIVEYELFSGEWWIGSGQEGVGE